MMARFAIVLLLLAYSSGANAFGDKASLREGMFRLGAALTIGLSQNTLSDRGTDILANYAAFRDGGAKPIKEVDDLVVSLSVVLEIYRDLSDMGCADFSFSKGCLSAINPLLSKLGAPEAKSDSYQGGVVRNLLNAIGSRTRSALEATK